MKQLGYFLVLLALAVAAKTVAAAPAEKPSATLCHAWDQGMRPMAPATSFLSDTRAVCFVLKFKEAPAKGEAFVPSVERILGTTKLVILRSKPSPMDGTTTSYASGFKVVGQKWARGGGSYRYVVRNATTKEIVAESSFTITAGRRHALIVGISDYAPKGPNKGDLPGVADEARAMQALLISAFGFQPENVRLLTSLDATADRIRKEMAAMAERAGENDAVFFYYSGHGTQIPDLDGDEDDGWDEAICPSDLKPKLMTRRDQLKLYITDDEIATMLARFKTKNVTVMFDSCHSGTAVRAGEEEIDVEGGMVSRSQKQGVGRKLVEEAEDARRKRPQPVANGLDIDERYVFLAASRSWETAAGNKEGGFFTRNMRIAMVFGNGLSWGEMTRRIRPGVHRFNPGQTPVATGAIRRYPFSLSEAPADAPYDRPTVAAMAGVKSEKERVYVPKVTKGQTVILSGLTTLGSENAGAVLDAYRSNQNASGKPKGRVRLTGRITSVNVRKGYDIKGAEAIVLSGEIQRGDRLVPLAVRVPDRNPSIGIAFPNNLAPNTKKQIGGLLQPLLKLLKQDPRVRLLFGVKFSTLDYIIVPRTIDGKMVITVITPTLSLVGTSTGSSADIAKTVQTLVAQRHANFTRFNRISNPSPELRIRVVAKGDGGPRKAGDTVRCVGYVNEPAYLYAFIAVEGGAPALRAASNAPIVPNSAFEFKIATPADGKGKFVIRVFASKKPLKLNNTTEQLLKELQRAYPAPGGGSDFIGTQGWTDESVWLKFR